MTLTIIAILRIVAALALLPLAALACAAPAPTVAPTATPAGEGEEPACSPHPFDILVMQALHQSVVR